MPQPDADGMIRIKEAEWREVMDQLNQLVRERNKARRQLSEARRVGRIACRLTLDAADVIDESNMVDPEDGESEDVRRRIAEIQETLKPKRRRR